MTDFISARVIRRAIPAILFTLTSMSAGAANLSDADYAVLAANDLGMHCADLDYKIFSIHLM